MGKIKPFLLPSSLMLLAVLVALYILVFGLPGLKSTTAPTNPVIENLSPTSGSVGEEVTVKGTGFTKTANNVLFTSQDSMPGYISNLESKDGKTLRFTVPNGLDLCPPSAEDLGIPCSLAYPQVTGGIYQVEVYNSQGGSNSTTFTVTD